MEAVERVLGGAGRTGDVKESVLKSVTCKTFSGL